MSGIIGASVTYRLAFGPHAGKKVLTLQAVQRPACAHRQKDCSRIRHNYSDICQR
ncbi:MAG: hypothetical protein VB996_00245 [Pseudomonadales bacterium]